MKKRLKLSVMTVFLAMLLGFAVMFIGTEQAFAMEGDGTAENPYKIATYADLKEFANIVNGTNGATQNTAACAVLTQDITCDDEVWLPIGTNATPYTGTFDGCGHVIKKLSNKDNGAANAQGLFGYIGNDGTVQNVGLEDAYIHGALNVGGVAGCNAKGTISNCYNTGAVTGNRYVGGVTGLNRGEIRSCYNTGSIIADIGVVGGVTGSTEGERGEIINCYNTGAVSGSSYDVGGVTGYIDVLGKATNCYNTGDVKGSNSVGGVCGVVGYSNYKPGTMTNCYNTGTVSGQQDVGGVAGRLRLGTISNCYYDKDRCGEIGAINGSDHTDKKVIGLTTEAMTGTKALENMEFVYGTGETSPWMTKTDGAGFWFYPHLEGFNLNKQGEQMKPGEISADYWPPKTEQQTVATPTFSPAAGDFGPSQSVSIECTTEGAKTYYTIDGTTPTADSKEYTEAITVSNTTTIKAIAVKERWANSEIAYSTYTHTHKYGAWTRLNATQHQKVCQHDKSHVIKENHKWDKGKVTKKASAKQAGVRTYTCTVCKATKTETIPKLKPSAPKVSGTPLAKMAAGKSSLTIGWNKIQGAAGYDIFFARCNHDNKKIATKNVKTIKGNKTFKWTKSGLKKGTAYKAYVRAYVYKNGKKTYVRNCPLMHAYTGNGTKNYTNAKSVTVNKTKVTLKKGKTFKIKAKVNKVNKKKKLMSKSHAPTLRYMTSNSKVATVSPSGKITAKGKGTCYIYVFAHNGVSKQIKVIVK